MVKMRLKVYKDAWVYVAQKIEERAINYFLPKIINKIKEN